MEETQQEQEQPLGPRVTVIIVSYLRGAALSRCLEALEKSQERKLLQIIVLDPGSHDTTPEWDLKYPETTFLRMPRNFGATKALNIGIRSAKANLLFFLDPAIEVSPDTISRLASLLEETPDAGAVCPLRVDAQGNILPQVRSLPDRDALWRLWQDDSALPAFTPETIEHATAIEYPGRKALLIRRNFLKGMNYLDEHYGEWGADLELAFQIRHASKKAYLIPDVRVLDHSATDPKTPWNSAQRAILAADRLNAVSHFLSKRAGFLAGILIRVQAVFYIFVRALILHDAAYSWSLLSALLGGNKVDGSQTSL
jgi:GT2 family glycosyltransferase